MLNRSPGNYDFFQKLEQQRSTLSRNRMLADQPIVYDSTFEKKELERRRNEFAAYDKRADDIRQTRQQDQKNRYKEKIRQLEEYIDLQGKIDQARRTMSEPREAFRQRFLEVERQRLKELAEKEQLLIDQDKSRTVATAGALKRRTSSKRKEKKQHH